MNFLIVLYFLLFLFLSRLNLKMAVLVLIFSLPSYLIRFNIFSVPTTLLEVMILIVFTFFLFNKRKEIFKNTTKKWAQKIPYPFSWEIILILALSFVAIFIADLNSSALGIFKAYFLDPIFLFIVIVNIFRSEKDIKKIFYALSLSALTVSLVAIWQKITGQFIFNEFWANPENRRVVSFFGYPNAVALYLGPIIPISIGLFIYKIKERGSLNSFLKQLILFITILSSCLAIYFSKSKGAILAIGLSFVFVIFILIKRKYKIYLLILFLALIPSFYFYKKDWINLKLSSSLSYQIRLIGWQETTSMLNDGNFLWGAGLANYQNKIKEYHQEGFFFNKDSDPDFKRKIIIFDDKYRAERWQPLEIYLYPHNIFLNFWTEIGLIGAIIFMFLIFKSLFISLKAGLKEKNSKESFLYLGIFSSLLIITIHGIFDVPYFKNDLSVLFWVILSILAIYQLKQKTKKYE